MDLGISGRTALVTGADSGIGWHTARMLIEEGAQVAVTDLKQDDIAAAAERLPSEDIPAIAADLTNPDDVARLRDDAIVALGRVDILVHSAATLGARGPFHEIDEDGWRSTLDTDLLAAVRVVRAFIDPMRAAGWGRIVLLASEDGQQPYPQALPYGVSKSGVLGLGKGLSKAYGGEGVLVNAVSPAFIESPMTDTMMQRLAQERGISVQEAIEAFLREERPFLVLRRRGKPEEVASMITFLCSERASFVTGSNCRVDGGAVPTI
ncbi:SDR family NAD(P)-dependent oxidoreductase [Pseudonocardia acidicola]|uniref:SDR family oxidoreductase n=1 Tax=Pseudonocardia acidicola TaxID=2724939 RepID=A0ABX1SIA9_9PSEU|nr:SDR family oxidoreductase [Pseudonocardia acidicola]NMI01307.1 SDR family oxidoreductase [Pseudonocardia acidicola]